MTLQSEDRSPVHWYAVQTLGGRENSVHECLRTVLARKATEFETFFPRRRLRIRNRAQYSCRDYPLLAGYLFVAAPSEKLRMLTVARPRGFVRVVGDGHQPRPVTSKEMATLFSLTNEAGIIEISEGILTGQHVTITKGPLRGHDGQIISVNRRKSRAKISLNIHNSPKLVDVGLHIVNFNPSN